eukprot:855980-Rhodomonas_salina.1
MNRKFPAIWKRAVRPAHSQHPAWFGGRSMRKPQELSPAAAQASNGAEPNQTTLVPLSHPGKVSREDGDSNAADSSENVVADSYHGPQLHPPQCLLVN